jgi:hypothetical protein
MKYISIILLAWMSFNQAGQDLYVCKNARINLFSSAPIEDIKAVSQTGASVYNPSTGQLGFSVTIRSFQFAKSLMQDHFNSDYMESDKYPKAIFNGTVKEPVDITKDGSYPITAEGSLSVHGVSQKRTIPGTLIIKNGAISMEASFMVKCADHHIDIPSIVFHNIAESIKVDVSATYTKYNPTN